MESQQLLFLISHTLINFLAGIYVVWVFEDICNRILSPLLAKLLRFQELSLLMYLLLRVISVALVDNPVYVYRACWYGYYPCFLASASVSVITAWLLGEGSDTNKILAWSKPLILFNILCGLLVLTNDYHNLCFSFEPDARANHFISHNEILLAPIKLFILLQYLITYLRMLYLAYNARYRFKRLLAPFILMLPAACYTYLYTIGYSPIVNTEHVAINTFFAAMFWHLSTKVKLLPSYGYYNDIIYSSPQSLEAEAIYHARNKLNNKMEQVLALENPRLLQLLQNIKGSNVSKAHRLLFFHQLKLSLSFIKKHCLLFLQLETNGYIEAEDFTAALKESLRYANDAGCNCFLFPYAVDKKLPAEVLFFHKAWNDLLQLSLIHQPDGLIFKFSCNEDELKLVCSTVPSAYIWLKDFTQESQKKYGLTAFLSKTEDASFLTISSKEVSDKWMTS